MEQPNYYSILPADVRYNENLTANEKILYSEITSLTYATGECWASNEYFAKLYNLSTRSITRMISNLKDNGLIEIEIVRKDNCKEIEKRIIRLRGIDKNVVGYRQKCLEGIDKNVQENNTSNNIKNEYIYNTPSPKEKHKFAEYQHVLLTDKEYEKLQQDFSNCDELIKYLDEYIEMKGYKAKSHNLAIRKWVVEAVDKEHQKKTSTPYKKFEYNEAAIEERNRRVAERIQAQEQANKIMQPQYDKVSMERLNSITKNMF
jgi:hypothetical protein